MSAQNPNASSIDTAPAGSHAREVAAAAAAAAASFGFTVAFDRRELVPAVLAFASFAAACIPIGIVSGFIHFGWRGVDALAVAALAYRIYFTFAIPEELLFRGVVQNAL